MSEKDSFSQNDDVRYCECHKMFWRPTAESDSLVVTARGSVDRDKFSGGDLVNNYVFTRKEWEALPRA